MQREVIDFVENFAQVPMVQSITCSIARAAYYNLNLEEMDMVTAFLNPDVEEPTRFQFFQGLEVLEKFKKGAPALRALEGLHDLKQAPRLWNDAVNATLHRVTLTRCYSECGACMIGRRPDVAFVLSELSENVSKPGKKDLFSATRILRYLQFSRHYHLEFSQEKLRTSYLSMVIVMVHGLSGRWFFDYRFCFQNLDWTTDLVCKEAVNNYSNYF
jgi:hypothetical protein